MGKIDHLISSLKSILPEGRVPLAEPYLHGNEAKYLKDCIDTNFVSSVGAYVDRFAKDLSEFTDLKIAIPVVNGTNALSVCYRLVGVERDDEVLMPAMTFVATANAASYLGAIPHFVDSSAQDLGVDCKKLADYLSKIVETKQGQAFNKNTGRRIGAFVVMHTFGLISADMPELVRILQQYNIPLVEDAAEALGSKLSGLHAGSWGQVSALSFNGNKIMTTGGGGAIITNDEKLGEEAFHLTRVAKKNHPWRFIHDSVGYNYRMPNLNAAVGCAQLEQMDKFLAAKKKIQKQYEDLFSSSQDFSMIVEPKGCESNYWLPAVLLPEDLSLPIDECLEKLNEEGVGVRPVWDLMNTLPMYSDCPKMDLSTAENLAQRIICLPSGVSLGADQ